MGFERIIEHKLFFLIAEEKKNPKINLIYMGKGKGILSKVYLQHLV